MKSTIKSIVSRQLFVFTCLMISLETSFAAASSYTLGEVASSITKSFRPLALLITGGCYVGGLAFMVGAIMKFKQHKDNPTQITIGTPIALLLVGSGLLFMPSVMGMAGVTMFGSTATTAGPSGSIY